MERAEKKEEEAQKGIEKRNLIKETNYTRRMKIWILCNITSKVLNFVLVIIPDLKLVHGNMKFNLVEPSLS